MNEGAEKLSVVELLRLLNAEKRDEFTAKLDASLAVFDSVEARLAQMADEFQSAVFEATMAVDRLEKAVMGSNNEKVSENGLYDRDELLSAPILFNESQRAFKEIQEKYPSKGLGFAKKIFLFLAMNVGRYFTYNNDALISYMRCGEPCCDDVLTIPAFLTSSLSNAGLKEILDGLGLKIDKRQCVSFNGRSSGCAAFGIVPK